MGALAFHEPVRPWREKRSRTLKYRKVVPLPPQAGEVNRTIRAPRGEKGLA